ncbi:hypothetical protein GYMLUDRAFT_842051 [Collybiopsis luxurians FD-317 M1]|uniref:C2H2-type domain-containing protein n=1 Tax=Collybiopsis luxurians FD-317 M1 TaxID=944289 RepID=A0A0D0CBB1_9AGAR|nr:hypothetical protein GYMLUDRAFT_842051 [Collybiopsis luxurians FD-317 M1]
MGDWYGYVVANYLGTNLEDLEAWFLGVPYLPPLVGFRRIHPEAEYCSPQGLYQCFYPGCEKKYRSPQNRDTHFDKVHLGFRYFCDLCGRTFVHKGSINQHRGLGRCPMTRSG